VFEPEDFEVSLEKQLILRVRLDEIDHCTNVDVLQESLKKTTEALLSCQNILAKVTERQIKGKLNVLLGSIDVTDKSKDDAN